MVLWKAWTLVSVGLCFAFVLGLPVPSVGQQAPTPTRQLPATLAVESIDGAALLWLENEIVHNPDQDPLFHTVGDFEVVGDGRLYVLDAGDPAVRVLSPAGRHLFSFGGKGEGPGEFAYVGQVAVSPAGLIYVFDAVRLDMTVFSSQGEFIERMQMPVQLDRGRSIRNFFFTDEETFVALAVSLFPPVYGMLVHRFRVEESAGRRSIRHLQGFSQPLDVDPVIYTRLTHGFITRDLDGGILFTQSAPYSVRKFSATGQLQWRLDDPQVLQHPTTFFDVGKRGQIVTRPYPVAVSLLPLGSRRYLHTILRPKSREGVTSVEQMKGSFFERSFEVLELRDDALIKIATFELGDEPLSFFQRDTKGRLYGYWYDGLNALIRSTVRFEWKPKRESSK